MSSHPKPTSKQRKSGFNRGEKIMGLVILAVAIWAVYSFAQPPPSTNTTTTVGPSATTHGYGAPDFSLPVVNGNGLTGEKITLSSLRGKVVLLEFMEPWCPVCQNMAPMIERLYSQYGSADVVFLSVAGPWNSATADDAAKFIREYGTPWIYVFDSSGIVFQTYGVTATPTFFVLGKDGTISNRYEGLNATYEILVADITRLNK